MSFRDSYLSFWEIVFLFGVLSLFIAPAGAEATGLAVAAVKMAAERKENKSVYLLGCDLKARALDLCKQFQDILGKENIKVTILNNVLYDAAALNSLENAEGVVLVEKSGIDFIC